MQRTLPATKGPDYHRAAGGTTKGEGDEINAHPPG